MTVYICQCPHNLPAKIWTANTQAEALSLIVGDTENTFDTLLDAARYDMRDAYVTDDALDLYVWASAAEAPVAIQATNQYLKNIDLKYDVEALATRKADADDIVYTAFDGAFTYNEDEAEWRLGNQPAVEAESLFAALCEAYLAMALANNMEQIDV